MKVVVATFVAQKLVKRHTKDAVPWIGGSNNTRSTGSGVDPNSYLDWGFVVDGRKYFGAAMIYGDSKIGNISSMIGIRGRKAAARNIGCYGKRRARFSTTVNGMHTVKNVGDLNVPSPIVSTLKSPNLPHKKSIMLYS